jgi:hypothetical protein
VESTGYRSSGSYSGVSKALLRAVYLQRVSTGDYTSPRSLSQYHSIDDFHCGEGDIDRWLRRRARNNHDLGYSGTFVTTEISDDVVVGFYCLSAASVSRKDLGDEEVGTDPPPYLPAVLLGRMGVSEQHKDRRMGTSLVKDAIVRTIVSSLHVGIRLMVVDAMNDGLVEWYQRFGFAPTEADPHGLVAITPSLRETYEQQGGELPSI